MASQGQTIQYGGGKGKKIKLGSSPLRQQLSCRPSPPRPLRTAARHIGKLILAILRVRERGSSPRGEGIHRRKRNEWNALCSLCPSLVPACEATLSVMKRRIQSAHCKLGRLFLFVGARAAPCRAGRLSCCARFRNSVVIRYREMAHDRVLTSHQTYYGGGHVRLIQLSPN
jgi:hypothetical protein